MDATHLRAWSFSHQGLDGSLAHLPAPEVLARTGWIRSVGGASPYLGLHARCGASRAAVDAFVASVALSELPSARGCTYLLPPSDYATGLRAGQGFGDAAAIATARKHLGVTDAELDALDDAVIASLVDGPLDPRALKDRLGDRVRNLGPEGKKRGTTTTLPLSLGRLQGRGRIRRVPVDGRLDRQRYAYTRWEPSPLDGDTRDDDTVRVDLARAYWGWAGYASLAQFQEFSGFGARVAKAAAAPLGLAPLVDGSPLLALPATLDALRSFRPPADEQIALIPSLDNLVHLRREVAPLLDPEDAMRPAWGEDRPRAGGALAELSHHAIVDRGRLVGYWDWDGRTGEMVWATYTPPTAAIRAAVARTEAFVRDDLGDARTFSLDAPEGRGERLAFLRAGL